VFLSAQLFLNYMPVVSFHLQVKKAAEHGVSNNMSTHCVICTFSYSVQAFQQLPTVRCCTAFKPVGLVGDSYLIS